VFHNGSCKAVNVTAEGFTQARPKLTYFAFAGGRIGPIRIALRQAKVDFEDERLSFQEFGARKVSFPGGSLPVLSINGKLLTQSLAILRWAGRQSDLYPSDPVHAMQVDEGGVVPAVRPQTSG